MTGIVERLRNISRGDHERGCQGREYVCSCDYDETSWKTAEEAADEITRLRRELEEARKALEPFAKIGGFMRYTPKERSVSMHYNAVESDGLNSRGSCSASVGDFRAARATLLATKEHQL